MSLLQDYQRWIANARAAGPADGAPDGSLGAEADVSHAVACMRRLCDED